MSMHMRPESRFRYPLLTALFASFLALLGNSAAQAQTPTQFNSYEQQAIKVVQDWMASWRSKDPNKIAAFMTDSVQFRPGGLYEKPEFKVGRKAFFDYYATDLNVVDSMELQTIYAAGDKGQAVVLVKRLDHFTAGKEKGTTAFAGFFRIRDGKIVQWEDVPTVQTSVGPPAPAPAATKKP